MALVGASFGGLVCLELAARRPELVTRSREEALLEQREWRAAAEWNADFWLSEASGSELRARIIEIQERAFKLHESEAEEIQHEPVELGAVRARSLSGRGRARQAGHLRNRRAAGRGIDGARAVRIEGAAHLPPLERPDVTARLVRDFLGR